MRSWKCLESRESGRRLCGLGRGRLEVLLAGGLLDCWTD